MNEKLSSNKSTITVILSVILFVILLCGGGFYVYNVKQKSPFERTYKISDTEVHIKTTYNNKYNIGRVDITINEPVEDWQIKSIGYNTTDIVLECETTDKSIKKDYEIQDIPLIKGENITGNRIFENLTLKDYVMMKDLLNGEITIDIPKYLTLDTEERDKLQQEFYKKEQDKVVKKQNRTNPKKNSPSFFNTLFDF